MEEFRHRRGDRTAPRKERTLEEMAVTNWLTPENASFAYRDGFLYLTYEGNETRVSLYLAFPFENENGFVSVLDENQDELGIIESLDLFGEEARKLLRDELARRYYSVHLLSLISSKDRYGYSFWRAKTKDGVIDFTVRDSFKNIWHVGEKKLIFNDENGNRFQIDDVTALDKNSYKMIEVYL